MIQKFLVVAIILAILFLVFYPKQVPQLLRRFGLGVGRAGRLGREFATGIEEANSPLAKAEMQAGEVVLARMLSEHPPCDDPDLQAAVTELGRRLSEHVERREIEYRFVAVESEEPNAYAVPGGGILITRGLVHLCGGDVDLLAGVLAHEVQHIDQRHSLNQLAASMAARTSSRFLRLGGGLIGGTVTQALEKLLVEGYRQDQEIEADLGGAGLAGRAGYDARGLARLLTLLERPSPDGQGPIWTLITYFNSHPPISERIARLHKSFRA
jgi:predicted Zn-dependent protease